MKDEDMIRTSVQFSEKQINQINEIRFSERFKSKADVIRRAWDYFVTHEYPQLVDY